MPWEAVRLVGSGLALAAFLSLVVAMIVRSQLTHRGRLLKDSNKAERVHLLESWFPSIQVGTEDLPENQRFKLAMALLEERRARLRSNERLLFAGVVAGLLVVVFAIWLGPGEPKTDGSATLCPDIGGRWRGNIGGVDYLMNVAQVQCDVTAFVSTGSWNHTIRATFSQKSQSFVGSMKRGATGGSGCHSFLALEVLVNSNDEIAFETEGTGCDAPLLTIGGEQIWSKVAPAA